MTMSIILIIFLSCPFFALAQDRKAMLDGQQVLIPKLDSKVPLSSHPRFQGFISNMFNRAGDFHGPNCYNTAFIASGIFSQDKNRYVSPEEFEAILKTNFDKVDHPEYKDILVMDAKSSRGHASFYLGDNLIFHKKSFGTQYHYRITDLTEAGVVEENEWTPGPMDDSSAQMNWPELGKLALEAYRLKFLKLPPLDPKYENLIISIESALLSDLKSWSIGRKWGITGEYLLEDLLVYLRKAKTDKLTEGLVISLKDQIYIFLEEVYFKSTRSSSNILEELCVPEHKEQLFSLIKDLGKVFGKSDDKIAAVLKKIEDQDKSLCRLRPLNELMSAN